MPINIPNDLPAYSVLEKENVFLMTEQRAKTQDIRALKIVIVNLMPKKIETETQILRVLGNTPLQVDIELVQMSTHTSKNTPQEHLLKFYKTFDDIKENYYDGMIITGAPVEQIDFEQVDYWNELCGIMEWSKTHVFSVFHICWGAQAGLYYHYNIQKHLLSKKMFGIYNHRITMVNHPLLRGFDEEFFAPHSRHTTVYAKDIEKCENLDVLAISNEAGVYLIADKECRQIFVTGHSEYDRYTLHNEYQRDLSQKLNIDMPYNYYNSDDITIRPSIKWRSHANLLYQNWLNYFVYQKTPFNIENIKISL